MTFRAESVMIRRRISMASRRSHARHLELRTRQLIPDTADDDDPVRAPGLTVDADDVTGMKSVETGRTLARDQQRVTAREVTARVAIGADPDRSTALVHTDDGEAILLKPVGKALRHCETPFPTQMPQLRNATSGLTRLSTLHGRQPLLNIGAAAPEYRGCCSRHPGPVRQPDLGPNLLSPEPGCRGSGARPGSGWLPKPQRAREARALAGASPDRRSAR